MDEKFLEGFEKVNKKTWLEKATQDLKGKNPEEQFAWEIEPGLNAYPYYSEEDLPEQQAAFDNRLLLTNHPTGQYRHWDNLQKIEVLDPKKSNQDGLDALQGGAEGIVFFLESTPDMETLLNGIKLEYCAVWFEVAATLELGDILKAEVLTTVNGGFITHSMDHAVIMAEWAADLPNVKVICDLPDSYESYTDTIAELLSTTRELATRLIDKNIATTSIFKTIAYSYRMGNQFFNEIAALKALRQLHFQIACAFDVSNFNPEDLHILAISTAWINEDFQPHGNMLKSTTAGMSGILGGCQSLLIEPESTDKPTMVRIARNVSNILKEEAYFSSQVDPVAGSYFLASITDAIAKESWKKFQKKVTSN